VAGKIFISYRREDAAANALGVSQYLTNEFGRRNVFLDIDMRAGTKFPLFLEQRLAQCKVMLVLIGPDWLNSSDEQGRRRLDIPDDWVRLEIAHALKRGITVIPVCVGGANLPPSTELPEDIRGLVDHQAISITHPGFRRDMSGLVRDIRDIPGRKSWPRLGLILAGVSLFLIALALTLLSIPSGSFKPVLESPRRAPTTTFNNIWSSPPGEWVLYGVDKLPVAYYFKPSSLQFFDDKSAYIARFPFKSMDSKLPSDQASFQSAYEDDETVVDCKSSVAALAEKTVYNKAHEIIYHYKQGDVRTLDLSSGVPIGPGSILSMAANIFCNEKFRSPLAHDPTTATWYISPLVPGESDLYSSPPSPPQKISDNVHALLAVTRNYRDRSFGDLFPGQEVVGLPHGYRTVVQPIQLNCDERKIETPKIEYFDADNNLASLVTPLPVPTLDIKEGTPLDLLFSKVCNTTSKYVAGNYEGTNYATYKIAGAEGDQKIAISVEQGGNQLKVSFQSPNGARGEGTGIIEGDAVKTILLKSSAPNCPGSYEVTLGFKDDGSMNWSYKGQDCSGPVEGHGTAKKATG
jgi:hypothetical protein